MPIGGDPAPALRPWMNASSADLQALDDALLAGIRALPGPALPTADGVTGLFAAQADILCTFPELDPLGPRAEGEYVGPVEDAPRGAQIAWRSASLPRVLACLDPRDARLAALIDALRAMPIEAVVAIPGLDAAAAEAASGEALRVVRGEVNVAALLEGATLLVCHATSDHVARAWIAGVPMALLPLQLEDYLRALRVTGAGAGVVATPEDSPADLQAWLAAAMARGELRDAAREGARRHHGFSHAEACLRAARRIAAIGT
jgi:UDP:flavonoid glycosyltransferase YjiC (YdhE family)